MSTAGAVVVVGPLPPPVHGAARVTLAMLEKLRSTRCPVEAFDTGVTGTGGRYHLNRLMVHLRAAARVLAGHRPRAVYVGGAGGFGVWYQFLVVAAARLRRVPIVFHHHSSHYLDHRARAMAAVCRVGGPSALHVALSEGMVARLQASYPRAARAIALSNSVFLRIPESPPPREESHTLVLAHVSNLSRAKGLHDVVSTFERLVGDGLDVRLKLAGPTATDADAQLIEQAARRHPGRLQYAGPVLPEQVLDFLAGVDVFLFPSRYRHEAEPLVVLEAAAVGAATICFDVGSLREVADQLNGWVVPPEASFADSVHALVAQPQRVGSPGSRQAVHSGVQRFASSHEATLSRLVSLLTE